jgi:GT2 family glycosyltransferase
LARLVVVIVSWNTCELTRNCLRSLLEEVKEIDHEVWVVDNASSDSSAAMVKEEFPRVRLIENAENLGFARANNQALRMALGEYYLLLNSDTIIPPDSIKAIIEYMDAHPEASAAAPNQRNSTGLIQTLPRKLPTLGGELRECLLYHFFPFSRLLRPFLLRKSGDVKLSNQPQRADILSAACLIIRRNVIEKIGYLAEDYFLFSEENDYFSRMKQVGLISYFLPHIEIIHLIGESRKKRGNIDSEVNFFRSRIKYFRKFHARKAVALLIIYRLFFGWSLVIAAAAKALRGDRENEYYEAYRALTRVLKEKPEIKSYTEGIPLG